MIGCIAYPVPFLLSRWPWKHWELPGPMILAWFT